MEYDVTVDRELWIGGSDIPAIMGISRFKTRWQLLLEKAGLSSSDFTGNKYTKYGSDMEPKIREYINLRRRSGEEYEPNRVFADDIRYHSDGFNGSSVLDVKTTAQIYSDILEYKTYLVQLLKGMEVNEVSHGLLCVYERPADFSLDFDPERLQAYPVRLDEWRWLLNEVNYELDRFRADLARLRENPLLTEEDFQPNELVTISNKVLALESRMAEYKAVEQEYKEMKQALYRAMLNNDIKSWTTLNGVKITRVDEIAPSTETALQFDEGAFMLANPDLHAKYCKFVDRKKTGRAGYVKISLP